MPAIAPRYARAFQKALVIARYCYTVSGVYTLIYFLMSSRTVKISIGTTIIQKTNSASEKSVTVKVVFGSSHQPAVPRDVVLMETVEHLLCEPISEILPKRSNLLVWTDVARANDSIALLIVVQGQEGTSLIQRQIDNMLVSVSVRTM